MLNRTGICGSKVETTEGTPESLTASEFQGKFKNLSHTYSAGEYDRALMKPTLTKEGLLKGTRLLTISGEEELVGGGASTPAPWHTRIRGMGFQTSATLKVIGVGSRSGGEFVVGQYIGNNATPGSATKVGRVVAVLLRSPDKIVIEPITGTFAAADTVYNYSSLTVAASPQASATLSGTLAAAGYVITPMSETASQTPPSLTMEHRLGEIHQITGGRGKGSLSFKMNEPALLKFEFTGPAVLHATTGRPTLDSSPITGITSVGAAPRISKGMPIYVNPGASTQIVPVLSEFGIEINNTLANRDTIASNDVANSGYLPTRIGDREIRATMDPENDLTGNKLDLVGRTMVTQTFTTSLDYGSEQDANGRLVILGDACQLTGDHTPGDKNGIQTVSTSIMFTGTGDDNEIKLYHFFVA